MLTGSQALEFEILLKLRDSLISPTFTHDQAEEVLETIYYDVVQPYRKNFRDDDWNNPDHELTNLLSRIIDGLHQFTIEFQNKNVPQRLSDIKHEFQSLASRKGLIGSDRPILSFDPEYSISQYNFAIPGIPYDLPDDLFKFAIQHKGADLHSNIYYDPDHYGAVHFIVPSWDDDTRYRLTLLLEDLELANIEESNTPNQLMNITTLERGNLTHIVAHPMTMILSHVISNFSYDQDGSKLSAGFPLYHDKDQRVYWSVYKESKPTLFAPSNADRQAINIYSTPAGHLDQLLNADVNGKHGLQPYHHGSKRHPWCQKYLHLKNDPTNSPFEFLANQLGVESIDAFYEGQRHAWINGGPTLIPNNYGTKPGPFRPE